MADVYVLEAQQWLNLTYGSVAGFLEVDEDGETGWQTMFALTRALQHELGITSLSDNFGPTTMAQLTAQFGNVSASTTNVNVVKIAQYGMFCKGYWGGDDMGDLSTALELPQMRLDAGLSSGWTIPPKLFKSLLTTDAYVLIPGGTSAVRGVQQWLNGRYIGRADFFLVPCDGVFSRNVQVGLMLAIQYELGMADGVANGNFGPGTQSGLRNNAHFENGDYDAGNKLVTLFQAALICNTYTVDLDGDFGPGTEAATLLFQSFAELPASGESDFATWASLLVSTGDPNRAASAFDTSTPLTPTTAAAAFGEGYRTVGRYLTVATKRLQPGEIETIFDAGLKLFPIFQNWNDGPEYFSEEIGWDEGYAAVRRARQLALEPTTIYWAVDYDATDEEIDAILIPHFEGLKEAVATSKLVAYSIGVYGTRNVCARLSAAGLVSSSFVSGLSTGFSGNLGFRLPTNWAYDQIQMTDVGSGPSYLEIDKVVQSVRAAPLQPSSYRPTPIRIVGGVSAFDETYYWRLVALEHLAEQHSLTPVSAWGAAEFVLHEIRLEDFWTDSWKVYTPLFEWSPGLSPAMALSYAEARGAFHAAVVSGGADYAPDPAGYEGDMTHFAASAIAMLKWPLLANSGAIGESDLGGWALDLVSTWVQYVELREAGPYSGGVAQWCRDYVGTTTINSRMGWDDLVSDIDAYLVARKVRQGIRLSDAIREVLVSAEADPAWRFQQFYQHRFGSLRANIVSAVEALFAVGVGTNPLITAPTDFFIEGERRPGDAGPSGPPPAELATELADLADAFADVIIDLT
ncbi:glycoside hydrolase domain-containing protein [Schumannella luteola]